MQIRSRVACAACVWLTFLWPAFGRAYSVPNHVALTARAVALVRECQAQHALQTGVLDGAITQILQHYDAEQDHWLNKTGLWHFPSVPEAPTDACPGPWPSCLMVIERSYEIWTDELWRRVQGKLTPDELYPALGAALHYVQDLAVPPHAVPVFHPPSVFKPSDGFDDYEGWDNAYSRPSGAALTAVCEEIGRAVSLPEILQRARAETLQSLSETFRARTNGKQVERPFSTFWRSNTQPLGYFGSYGCEDDFGESEVRCGGVTYEVAPAEYQAYAGRRAEAAIRFSAATIVLFQRHVAPCTKASCEPEQGDDEWYPTRSHVRALSER